MMAAKRKKIDSERIRKAVKEILLAVGEDVDREGLKDTPDRVARMHVDVTTGLLDFEARDLVRRTGIGGKLQLKLGGMVQTLDVRASQAIERPVTPS